MGKLAAPVRVDKEMMFTNRQLVALMWPLLLEQQRPHQRDELAIRKHHFLVNAHRRCQFAHAFTLLVSIEPVS